MTREDRQNLLLLEKVDLIPALFSIIAVGAYSVLSGLFRSQLDAPTLRLHIFYAILRKSTQRLSPRQLQWLSPTTEEVYVQWAKAAKATPLTVDLCYGGKGHWIGNPEAKNVLVWYHGGGFALPANQGYFKFWDQLVDTARYYGKDLGIFAVTYSLAPKAKYPTQLRQAVGGLRHIVLETGRQPHQVLIAGDSAGGNLCVGVLSHLAHTHPEIPELKLPESLAGAATIAPWTDLTVRDEQPPRYHGGDLITPYVGKVWSENYLQYGKRDYYTDASNAPSSWFETFPIHSMLILAGENEIMLPDIKSFAENMKKGLPATELFVAPREAHVAPIENLELGDHTPTHQGERLKSWLIKML